MWRPKDPSRWPGPSVIVTTEKNDSRYLDATTEDALHASALHLLRERFESGDYYPDPNDEARSEPKVDFEGEAEVLERLAEDSPIRQLHERQVSTRNRWRSEHARYIRWHKHATAALEGGDGLLAWKCLLARDGHEYEGVRLERIEIHGSSALVAAGRAEK